MIPVDVERSHEERGLPRVQAPNTITILGECNEEETNSCERTELSGKTSIIPKSRQS